MIDDDKTAGTVKYRGRRRIYTADFDVTSDGLICLIPSNFTAAVPAIKKMPNMSYEETALSQLKKLVDDEIEAR